VKLTGCDNARDLGGLRLAGGGRTRSGVLIRSDTVQSLCADDVRVLVDEIGLRTVVDLRAEPEAVREGRGPLADTAVDYHNLSFIPGEFVMPDDPRFPLIMQDLQSVEQVEHYLNMVRLAGTAVARALRVLARPGATPALFHCAAGKDRTGVLSALLLEIAGAEPAEIVADYELTNARLALVDARLARLPSYRAALHDGSAEAVGRTRCRPEVMVTFLDTVERIWGGAAAWARSAGVSVGELAALRALLAEG
jgi:protein-tyrosine phosphatase